MVNKNLILYFQRARHVFSESHYQNLNIFQLYLLHQNLRESNFQITSLFFLFLKILRTHLSLFCENLNLNIYKFSDYAYNTICPDIIFIWML